MRVVTGDGADPPPGRYDRVIFTAGCWSLPAARSCDALADGVLVAPLRFNGLELLMALRRDGDALRGRGGIPCGFLPLRGGDDATAAGAAERPWRWPLGAGGVAIADADLGVEGRGSLDRHARHPGRDAGDPLGLAEDEPALDALLWLGLDGDPLITLLRPGERRAGWTVALDVLPGSLLVFAFASRFHDVEATTLHGGAGALRACEASVAAWRAAGSPGPAELTIAVEPATDRVSWSLPARHGGGAASALRGDHRWTLGYGLQRLLAPVGGERVVVVVRDRAVPGALVHPLRPRLLRARVEPRTHSRAPARAPRAPRAARARRRPHAPPGRRTSA